MNQFPVYIILNTDPITGLFDSYKIINCKHEELNDDNLVILDSDNVKANCTNCLNAFELIAYSNETIRDQEEDFILSDGSSEEIGAQQEKSGRSKKKSRQVNKAKKSQIHVIVNCDPSTTLVSYNIVSSREQDIDALVKLTSRNNKIDCSNCNYRLEIILYRSEEEQQQEDEFIIKIEEIDESNTFEIQDDIQEDDFDGDVIEDYTIDIEEETDELQVKGKIRKTKPKNVSQILDDNNWNETEDQKCSRCYKRFKNLAGLMSHQNYCGKSSKVKGVVKKNKPEKFICEFCNIEYKAKSRLKIHFKTIHLGQYSHECEVCGKKFHAKSLCEIHTRTHLAQEDRPFGCTECTKRFKSTGELDKHIYRVHVPVEEKPCYACEECDFSTTVLESMSKHKLTHLPDDQKPFHCQFCSKGFTSKSDKDHHEMIHTNEKPHPCSACDRGFKTNAEMKEHFIKMHTNERPFICELCEYAYNDRFSYRRHVTNHEKQLGIRLDKSIRKFNVKLNNVLKKNKTEDT